MTKKPVKAGRWWVWDEMTGRAYGKRDRAYGGGLSVKEPCQTKREAAAVMRVLGDGGMWVVTQEELDRILIQKELTK